jgi:hypothetical protein
VVAAGVVEAPTGAADESPASPAVGRVLLAAAVVAQVGAFGALAGSGSPPASPACGASGVTGAGAVSLVETPNLVAGEPKVASSVGPGAAPSLVAGDWEGPNTGARGAGVAPVDGLSPAGDTAAEASVLWGSQLGLPGWPDETGCRAGIGFHCGACVVGVADSAAEPACV